MSLPKPRNWLAGGSCETGRRARGAGGSFVRTAPQRPMPSSEGPRKSGKRSRFECDDQSARQSTSGGRWQLSPVLVAQPLRQNHKRMVGCCRGNLCIGA